MPSTISPLPRFRVGRIDRGNRAACGERAQQMAQRGADRGVGKAAERRHLAFERPASGQFGDRREQRDAAPRDAQRAHQRSPIFAAVFPVLRSRRAISSKGRVGPLLDQPGQEIPFGDRDARRETGCCRTARPAACRLPACRSRRGRGRRDSRPPPRRARRSRRTGPVRAAGGRRDPAEGPDWRPSRRRHPITASPHESDHGPSAAATHSGSRHERAADRRRSPPRGRRRPAPRRPAALSRSGPASRRAARIACCAGAGRSSPR